MKKQITIMFCVAAMGMFAFSCKKSSSPSPQSEIVGSWKISSVSIDTSRSGTLNYTITSDTSWANTLITFSSNGTEITSYYGVPQSQSSWAFVDNNTYIKVVDTGSTGTTVYAQVVSISSSKMIIKDTAVSTGNLSQVTYTKQ